MYVKLANRQTTGGSFMLLCVLLLIDFLSGEMPVPYNGTPG